GSRYFTEKAPLRDYTDLDQRLRSGEISLAVEIPPNFGRDLKRGNTPQVGFWVDGAMPTRADTIRGYVQGIHLSYLQQLSREATGNAPQSQVGCPSRYPFSRGVQSLPAMAPPVIPPWPMLIPAMLTARGVVREKELGAITYPCVTPVTRLQ